MTLEVISFLFGILLLSIAILGGGFEVKEIKIPKVGRVARTVSLFASVVFLGLGIASFGGGPSTPSAALVGDAGDAPPETAPALSEEAYLDVIDRQLEDVWDALEQEGFTLSGDFIYDRLASEETRTHTVSLAAGVTYQIRAACDQDCGDLDLFVYDAEDNLLGDDEEGDDHPSVRIEPAETPRVVDVEVDMLECDTGTCYYGVAVFGK